MLLLLLEERCRTTLRAIRTELRVLPREQFKPLEEAVLALNDSDELVHYELVVLQ